METETKQKKADDIYAQIADNISGKVHCPQCQTLLLREQVEIEDGFMYCKICKYMIARGD